MERTRKIEKLSTILADKNGNISQTAMVEIVDKINEIIDHLNSRPTVKKGAREEREDKVDFIWYRIKQGETMKRIAIKNGIDDLETEDGFVKEGWKILWEFNKDLAQNPNLLIYIDENKYTDAWCIRNKTGVLRIPIR